MRIFWTEEFERGWAWQHNNVTVHGYRTRRAALRGFYAEHGDKAFEAGIRYGRKLERERARCTA